MLIYDYKFRGMKRAKIIAFASAMAVFAGCGNIEKNYPDSIRIEGDRFHVQGIAYDADKEVIYSSFTTSFLKNGTDGELIGAATGISGHLGDMVFDTKTRKAYASLEYKNDAIGSHISKGTGTAEVRQSRFYVAEISVDMIDSLETPFEEVAVLHSIDEAADDYSATVDLDGMSVEHRYGCSGIDGITIAPAFGKGGKGKYLYVAYGIYGDTGRCDNDYNILLCYDLKDLSRPLHKYFIHTGNTSYGVQNLAYDSFTDRMYLAVYKGKKEEYPNYSLFALDMRQEPFCEPLVNVPYQSEAVEQLSVSEGWHFNLGSTGLNPLCDGHYYISQDGKEDGRQYCNASLYTAAEGSDAPFSRKI